MCMWDPNLFISKLFSIYALTSRSILISRVTSLSHKPFDDSMEHILLVMEERTLIANTNRSEIFSSFRDQFGEDLEHNSSILLVFILIFTDLNVKESLHIFFVESRKLRVVLFNFSSFFFLINSLREEFLHRVSLT